MCVLDPLINSIMVWICIYSIFGYKFSGEYINSPPVDGRNPSELQTAEPWANPSGKLLTITAIF